MAHCSDGRKKLLIYPIEVKIDSTTRGDSWMNKVRAIKYRSSKPKDKPESAFYSCGMIRHCKQDCRSTT